MTLKMTTAQVVEKSVTVTNSSFQNYTHPDDHTTQTTDTPGFKPFTMLVELITNVSFRFSLLRSVSCIVCGWLFHRSCHYSNLHYTTPNSPCGEGKRFLAGEGRASTADARPSIAATLPPCLFSSSPPFCTGITTLPPCLFSSSHSCTGGPGAPIRGGNVGG